MDILTYYVDLSFYLTDVLYENVSYRKEESWRVSQVEQELITLLEHLSSILVFIGVCVAQSLIFCVVFYRSLFVLFLLAIVFSVLDSDYPFGISKLFLFSSWPEDPWKLLISNMNPFVFNYKLSMYLQNGRRFVSADDYFQSRTTTLYTGRSRIWSSSITVLCPDVWRVCNFVIESNMRS